MMNRREFSIGTGALGAALATASFGSRAQGLRTIRVANGAGVIDAQQCVFTCGLSPKLGYYRTEGVDLELLNMSNVSQTMQSIVTGETMIAPLVPSLFLPALSKNPGLDIVAVYNWLPQNANTVAVLPGSPAKSITDLKGKKIGIRNAGDYGVYVVRSMFRELGADDSTIEFISVGDGGTAGVALQQGRVDAIASYDTAAARIEMVGIPLRYLPLTPGFAKLSSSYIGVSQKTLKEERKALVGLFRGMAKSMVFAHTNVEEAIKLHWSVFPESKSKTKSDAEALMEVKLLLRDRKDHWMRRPDDPEKRIGAIADSDMKAQIALAAETSNDPQLVSKLGDVSKIYSNLLIDDVNAFDRAAIVKQALAFKS